MLIALANGWWLIALRGIAGVLLGVAVCTEPGITVTALASLYSAYALIDGGLALLGATAACRAGERRGILLIEGVLVIAAGLAALPWPGVTVPVLGAVMATKSVVTGLAQACTAMSMRNCATLARPLALAGVASLLFAAAVTMTPLTGALDLVLALGSYTCIMGPLLIVFGRWLGAWMKSNDLGDYIPPRPADSGRLPGRSHARAQH